MHAHDYLNVGDVIIRCLLVKLMTRLLHNLHSSVHTQYVMRVLRYLIYVGLNVYTCEILSHYNIAHKQVYNIFLYVPIFYKIYSRPNYEGNAYHQRPIGLK